MCALLSKRSTATRIEVCGWLRLAEERRYWRAAALNSNIRPSRDDFAFPLQQVGPTNHLNARVP
jgi:hypothetical protein